MRQVAGAILAVVLLVPATALGGLGDCGQPVSAGSAPTATDALLTLQAVVGLVACDLTICDVNDSGAVSATDALTVLQLALLLDVELRCPLPAETFQNDGAALVATSTRIGEERITVVTNAQDAEVLRVTIAVNEIVLAFPATMETSRIDFDPPLGTLPSTFAANRIALLVAGSLEADAQALAPGWERQVLGGDNPGCDWFCDSVCTLGCCAQHDRCYQQHGCTAASWLELRTFPLSQCAICNVLAATCIAGACSGIHDPATDDLCYDGECFFDCGAVEPGQGCVLRENLCACDSTCHPNVCGDSACDPLENDCSCPVDCQGTCSSPATTTTTVDDSPTTTVSTSPTTTLGVGISGLVHFTGDFTDETLVTFGDCTYTAGLFARVGLEFEVESGVVVVVRMETPVSLGFFPYQQDVITCPLPPFRNATLRDNAAFAGGSVMASDEGNGFVISLSVSGGPESTSIGGTVSLDTTETLPVGGAIVLVPCTKNQNGQCVPD